MCGPNVECNKPEISKGKPENCSLNQIIECHGNVALKEILDWYKEKKE
jgi:hypothetical protein